MDCVRCSMRNFAVAVAFMAASAWIAEAQAVVPMNNFKVGDWAELHQGNQWVPVTIASPLAFGGYKVNAGPLILGAGANSSTLRPYTPTAADLALQAETKTAMGHRPQGNTTGAKFGTREPAVCSNRKSAITAASARQYFICDSEGVLTRDTLYLVSNATVEIGAARPFNYNLDSASQGIDAHQLVYDIRGSYSSYQCGPQSAGYNDFANTHNCNRYDVVGAKGQCWKNTAGDWHCVLNGTAPQIKNQMPPES